MKNVRLIRKDENAVSPVIATILMVAITVVLAAVLYVMVSGLIGGGPSTTKPAVTFGSTTAITNGFTFSVAGATPASAIGNYRVNLQVNATTAPTPVTPAASVTISVGGSTYTITWTDPGGEASLTGGDEFRITRAGGLLGNTDYKFLLLWSDGTLVQSAIYHS